MFIIESKFGNDGYATWFKILETLAKTDDHWIDLKDESNLMFLSAKCNIDEDRLIQIIESVVKLGELDAKLWSQQRVIWCQKFTDSIEDAYRKRGNECYSKPSLLRHLKGLGRNIKGLGSSKGGENPQSKVKESKEEKNRLIIWLEEHAPRVQQMSKPITNSEAERLKEEFSSDVIIEIFTNMHNYKPLTKSVSANLTFRKWVKNRQTEPNEVFIPEPPKL